MNNTVHVESSGVKGLLIALMVGFATALGDSANASPTSPETNMASSQTLSKTQRSIVPIAAFTGVGDMPRLSVALNEGLNAGLTVSATKEVLIQLYAYAGFPRSLNALGELMKVLDARKQRGVQDAPGRAPAPVPTGKALLELGTANQTKLAGAPVKAPLYDFAPGINAFLKTHLFGDIFARDNLDWQSRELATVATLAALPGLESQLQSHMRFSMNVGLTEAQLREVGQLLSANGQLDAGLRAKAALEKQIATTAPGR